MNLLKNKLIKKIFFEIFENFRKLKSYIFTSGRQNCSNLTWKSDSSCQHLYYDSWKRLDSWFWVKIWWFLSRFVFLLVHGVIWFVILATGRPAEQNKTQGGYTIVGFVYAQTNFLRHFLRMIFLNFGLRVNNFLAFDLRFDFSMPRSTLCYFLRRIACD